MLKTQPRQSASSQPADRQVVSLDGLWDFSYGGPAGTLAGETLVVPGVWQAHFAALRNSAGIGTYARTVEVPDLAAGDQLILVFDGIFHLATVRIDGKVVGTHANPWTPLEIDVTVAVADKATFALEVAATVPDDTAYAESGGIGTLLHGKQDWYGLQGGIWKSVRMEVRPQVHLSALRVTAETHLTTHTIAIETKLSRQTDATIRVAIRRDGTLVTEQDFAANHAALVTLDHVGLWSPDAPNLYDVEVALLVAGNTVDTQTRTVGFRRFEARDGRLYLNGAPFYMIGALDQDWHPEEEARAPDAAFLEQRFANARALGLNTLRCHVKIPDPLYFDLADRLGLIVWLDMPYMEFLAPSTRTQLIETFEAAVANHGHHASICIWTIINEGWGIDLDDNPDDRAWLSASFDRLKPLIGSSLLVDNSPCFPRNYHVKTEIEDFHWYNSWPSQNDQFQATTDAFAARAAWSFSPHGDATRTGTEPLVVSEFGVWGLPHPRDIREKDGREPWWFESGHDWNNGAGYPHGIETRFRDAGLGRIFGNLDGFVAAAQEAQYRGLKHQIETLRYAEPISGYVITELNDTQWEANGLMDARNNVRVFGPRLAQLQQPSLVIARTDRTTLRPGESIDVHARLTSAAPAPQGASLAWSFDSHTGRIPLTPSTSGSAEITFTATAGAASTLAVRPLTLEVRDATGALLSANSLELCVIPEVTETPALRPADPWAEQILDTIRWPTVSADPTATLLATRLTTGVREALLAGRKVLLIANDMRALSDPQRKLPERDLVNFPKVEMRLREGTFWDGRWMGAFTWRRTDGPWAALPNGPMLDEHWAGLLPEYVLTGFRSSAFNGLVDAGVAVAWIHKAAAFSKRSFLGKGWLTVATFDFTSAPARQNPLAPHLLRALALS